MPERQLLIDEAWRRMPQGPAVSGPGRFTRARFERITELFVALGAVVLGAQAVLVAIGDGQLGAHPIALVATVITLTAMIVACATGRLARPASGVFAVVFVAVLLLWAVIDTAPAARDDQPWPFFLLSIAAGAAIVAFPLTWQAVWAVAPPLLFGAAIVVRGGFTAEAWQMVAADTSMAILLNVLIVALGWMFRGISDGVDAARARVVEAYAAARVAEATERERVEIAALMHDSVLAALIAAARADTPRARRLAAEMSREALTRLADAETDGPEGSDEAVDVPGIADAIERAAADLGIGLRVEGRRDASERVPGRVARALVLAATQAIANAVHHADAVGLAVEAEGDERGVRVTVSDRGPGVDLDAIPADRLGIRASIIARLAAVGGRADIASGQEGTTVTLTWGRGGRREGGDG